MRFLVLLLCISLVMPALAKTNGDSVCPTSLVATPDQTNKIVLLSWNISGAGATGYDIIRDSIVIATIAAGSTNYIDVMPPNFGPGHFTFEYVVASVGLTPVCESNAVRVTISSGTVVLFDDFESYSVDADMTVAGWQMIDVNSPLENAIWTMTNPSNKANPPLSDGRPTSGNFIISDSDWGGGGANTNIPGSGMSHDIWSPVIDCSVLSEVYLHMDVVAHLNENEGAVMYVDVTNDGGLSWQTLFERASPGRTFAPSMPTTSNSDGFYGRLNLDLTAYSAFLPTVQFRIRHFEPSWDWFISIDNVFVDDVDLESAGSNSILAVEDFSAGIPATWTLQGLNTGNDTWNTNDPCARSIVAAAAAFPYQNGRAINRFDGFFAILDSDCNPDPSENEYLLTPILDCSMQTEVFLGYKSEYMHYSGANTPVLVSIDGGATFLPRAIHSYTAGASLLSNQEPLYGDYLFSVPEAAGQPTVVFAFRYWSVGNRWFWGVDDVHVTGNTNIAASVGQAPRPGIAELDVSGALEQNGLPIASGLAGPYAVTLVSGLDDFSVTLGGATNQPVILLEGALNPAAFVLPGPLGQLDIGIPNPNPPFIPSGITVLVDGSSGQFFDSFFHTGASGARTINFGPSIMPAGVMMTLQALVNTGGPTVIAVSNAVSVSIL